LELVEASCSDDLCTVEGVPTPATDRYGDPLYWMPLKVTGSRVGHGKLRVVARSVVAYERLYEDTTSLEVVP
jgi:hypothetical protein